MGNGYQRIADMADDDSKMPLGRSEWFAFFKKHWSSTACWVTEDGWKTIRSKKMPKITSFDTIEYGDEQPSAVTYYMTNGMVVHIEVVDGKAEVRVNNVIECTANLYGHYNKIAKNGLTSNKD